MRGRAGVKDIEGALKGTSLDVIRSFEGLCGNLKMVRNVKINIKIWGTRRVKPLT
jgi:hypothetical protein